MQHQQMALPKWLTDRINPDYLEEIYNVQIHMMEDFEGYMEKHEIFVKGNSVDIKALPHPQRIKKFGLMPLHIELGIFDEYESIGLVFDLISDKNIEISHIANHLAEGSPGFRRMLDKLVSESVDTNFGTLQASFYSHRFFSLGERYFELTSALTGMLERTDLGAKCPVHYLRAPFPSQFFNAPANIEISNPISGMHRVEGFYLNEYTYTQEEFEFIKKERKRSGNLFNEFFEKGVLTEDGGDIHALEIMFVGHAKDYNFDDATYNFSLLYQDHTMSVEELIQHHITYYMKSFVGVSSYKTEAMTTEQAGFFEKCMNHVAKTLLYVNSDESERREINNLGELKKKINRALNKSKKRKLQSRKSSTSDVILIGRDSYGDFSSGGGTTKDRKTHWRRGHFAKRLIGKGRKNSKMVWLKPIVIAGGDKVAVGKTYKVV